MGSKHRETDESTKRQAEGFHCFEVFETPDETRSTSFLNDFSNETIKYVTDNLCSDAILPFSVTLTCMINCFGVVGV